MDIPSIVKLACLGMAVAFVFSIVTNIVTGSQILPRCFGPFGHDWAKWEAYSVQFTLDDKPSGIHVRQRRTCNGCGKMQDKKIRGDFY